MPNQLSLRLKSNCCLISSPIRGKDLVKIIEKTSVTAGKSSEPGIRISKSIRIVYFEIAGREKSAVAQLTSRRATHFSIDDEPAGNQSEY